MPWASVGLPGDGDAQAGVERGVDAELGVAVVDDAHQRRAIQPDDRPLVPLDDDVGDIELREDLEDVWRRVANVPRLGGVGTNNDPYDDGAESWFLAVLDGREASRRQRRVLETADPHRRDDLRHDVVPHLAELRAEDAMGSFGRDLEETSARRKGFVSRSERHMSRRSPTPW